jgi:uncharacterized membrane protein YbaN (DUF454 family)
MDKFKHSMMLILGWFLVGLGILGLFLPFLQGFLFIMIGLAILSTRSEQVKRLLKHLEVRYPRHHERVMIWRGKIRRWFNMGS